VGTSLLEFIQPPGLLNGDPPSWYAVIRPDELPPTVYDTTPRSAPDGASPRIFIMEPGAESDVFVSTYDCSLAYITDIWYPTREQAITSCDEQFGSELSPWMPIPENESPEKYVLSTIASAWNVKDGPR
jgi:hypothetical protein